MKFRFRYQLDSDGTYFARCLDFRWSTASGSTLEDLKINSARALKEDLTVPPNTRIYRTPPSANVPSTANEFTVVVEPGTAFALSLRELRTCRLLFQRDVAERLGMQLSAYQRLEDPIRANPTLETVARVQKIFPQLDIANLFDSET